ncbi:non-canonical purine NTP pyrophosphatase [Alienimonas californiensis]|uniref:dITP/XTP pyrophosphatase n=1 Tax=Alienimonas californiensis TaxID=2527989 RepID=A0A517P6D6_9PLAN|nr:non-canonical purine NTP pyrophosphatase [Alienimonas californiensis]QDT14941.1 Non-canonical purine NTP pyrophosphatase [Alienimonas californiensis]
MLILATRNRKKLAEVVDLLARYGVRGEQVKDVSVFDEGEELAQFGPVPEVVEDGETFAANAALKAMQTAAFLAGQGFDAFVLGEDSGLCVDALKGAPGVYSARYAGSHGDDEANNDKLLRELDGVPPERRGAGYVSSVAVANPAGELVLTAEDACRGRIATERRGTGGFGYDPLFEIRELHCTFGELPPAVKRALSHRGRTLRSLGPRLAGLLRSSS